MAFLTGDCRPRRTRLCLLTVALVVTLQVLLLFYCQLAINNSNDAISSSAVLTESLKTFLSYPSGTEEMNAEKNTSLHDAAFQKLVNQLRSDAKHTNETDVSNPAQPMVANNKTGSTLESAESASLQGFSNVTNARDIPDWLKHYIAWHQQQRKDLSPDNWNVDRKYLIMQCVHSDNRCGGTADRLKPIPTLLYIAYQYNRILLIRWERPCKLEEFLQPPADGLDWRVPDWLAPKLGDMPLGSTIRQIRFYMRKNGGNDVVASSRYQSYNGGADYYSEQHNSTGASFDDIYHDVWHAIFEPVSAVQKVIDETMKSMSLVPGEYAAAHLRAVYGVKSRPMDVIRNWAINAVNCASQLRPGGPIFFAADSKYAIEVVQQYAGNHSRKIVSRVHEKEPLHLEKSNHTNRDPSEYYDTFVDLYLLGNSRCLSYNVGGFGTWGLLIGHDASCGYQHAPRHRSNFHKCDWADAPPSNERTQAS